MSAHNDFNTPNKDGQMLAGNDYQQPTFGIGSFIREVLDTYRQVRTVRRRRLVARRAGAIPNHLRRDLGFEPGIDMEIAVKASAPAYLVHAITGPLANHALAPHDWPVAGANDNVSWRPRRSWLALA